MRRKASSESARALLTTIASSGVLPEGIRPARAAAAVLCTLTAHLTRGVAQDLMHELPAVIQPLLRNCVIHRGERPFTFDRDQFDRVVAEHLGVTPEQAEELSLVVFSFIRHRISLDESADIESQLPKDLKSLWKAA